MYATSELILDTRRPLKNGLFPVKLRLTFLRKQKLFKTPYTFTSQSDFEKGKKKDFKLKFSVIENKAMDITEKLGDCFTFEQFETLFFGNRAIGGKLEETFNAYIDTIEPERIGNIQSYKEALRSFTVYKPKAAIGDITPKWLRSYESYMIELGRSYTTVGIYTRALRSVLNWLINDVKGLSRERYPFGSAKKGLYEPPTGRNKKKALELNDIAKIFNLKLPKASTAEKMRDYWMFIYLCNGLNVADFCKLKLGNIQGDTLQFIREKTKRTKREVEPVQIHLQEAAQKIIRKHGSKSLDKNSYLFPHLKAGMNFEEQDKTVANLVRLINDYMKTIAKNVGIDKPVTTYYARHSFATILKNSGASVAMISQMLGHTSIATTQNYLDGFETDQIKKATKVLLDFDKAKEA